LLSPNFRDLERSYLVADLGGCRYGALDVLATWCGFTGWDTCLANQQRIRTNIRPQAREPGTGAVREGCALLQGLATCGACGRKLAVFYRGPAKTVPNYYCQGSAELAGGRGPGT
jgi:hypothetical protein